MSPSFCATQQINSFLQHFKPEWALCIGFDIDEKIKLVKTAYPAFKLTDVFPWADELSDGIDKEAFLKSFFVQPDLFIRVRKGFEQHVKAILTKESITFKDEGNGCLSLPNGTRLETIFPQQNWFEVQDLVLTTNSPIL